MTNVSTSRGGAAESGNESEVSHRQRHHRRSEESLTYTESQWKDMHLRVRGGNYSGYVFLMQQ